mmetsp:Transcript_19866/g.28130  ORF Transcript_19866/g.28130 Transcript_19866/m.28130 type:complete len:167 (-) Transcript_19866:159-659(-)
MNFILACIISILACVAFGSAAATLEVDASAINNSASDVINDDQTVCVTLEKYKDMKCKGDPVGTHVFPSLTAPGSPCKHTDNMGHNSAKDQYCDLVKGVFHQKVYVDNTKCHVKIYQKAYSPMHLEYTAKKCTYGYKLGSCTLGPCPSDFEDADVQVPQIAQLRLR